MAFERSGGVLLHPTSLPGSYGVGELGEHARAFVDWLAAARQSYWQVMPLGTTGYGDSPYQSFSAFAGNPYLISLDALLEEGLLIEEDLSELPDFDPRRVDFGLQYTWRSAVLRAAFDRFEGEAFADLKGEFETFQKEEAGWLSDYALFMALKHAHDGKPWQEWEADIRARRAAAMARWRELLAREIRLNEFLQLLFFRQWRALRAYALGKGVQVIGDIPIFVAMDSADAWADPEQFLFDAEGQPLAVAGVPPDYFSATGQLWGNPLYDWDSMQKDGFRWWIRRFQGSLKLYDVVRVDHFRGFAAYWEVPYPAEDAMRGRWVPAPGHALFKAVQGALGELPIIAEDLGVITPDVEALRDAFGFPGMAVLQFAFASDDGDENLFLPQNVPVNRVIYTGTHDNDTTRGWWTTAPKDVRAHVKTYLPKITGETAAWQFLNLAWASRAALAVVPLQDLLNLGGAGRMNLPGSLSDENWSWRAVAADFTPALARRLAELAREHGR